MRHFLRDLSAYIVALWREWKALLTGGSIIALASLWMYSHSKPIPANVNWLIVGLTLVLASFLAWRKQLRPPHTIAEIHRIEVTNNALKRHGANAVDLLRFLRQVGVIVVNQHGKGNFPAGTDYFKTAKPLLDVLMEEGLVFKKDNVVARLTTQDQLVDRIFNTQLVSTEWRISEGVRDILDDLLYPSDR
jgi:hypothetical protein